MRSFNSSVSPFFIKWIKWGIMQGQVQPGYQGPGQAFTECLIISVQLLSVLAFYKWRNWGPQKECFCLVTQPITWAKIQTWVCPIVETGILNVKLSGLFITPNPEAQMWGSELFGDVRYSNKTKCFWTSIYNRCGLKNHIRVESCFSLAFITWIILWLCLSCSIFSLRDA